MNGHSNIGYNIFISFTKFFFIKFTSLVRLQQRAQMLFFMLYNLIFIIFRIEKFYSNSYCL